MISKNSLSYLFVATAVQQLAVSNFMLDTIADSKKEKANMMVNQGLGVGGQPGALLNDPMSALQSLTRTPNPNIPGAQALPMQSESLHHA